MTAPLSGTGPDRIGPVQIFNVTGPVGPFFSWTVRSLIKTANTNNDRLKYWVLDNLLWNKMKSGVDTAKLRTSLRRRFNPSMWSSVGFNSPPGLVNTQSFHHAYSPLDVQLASKQSIHQATSCRICEASHHSKCYQQQQQQQQQYMYYRSIFNNFSLSSSFSIKDFKHNIQFKEVGTKLKQ